MNATMLQEFSTADDLKSSFNSDIAAGFAVIFFMAAAAMLFAWIGRRKEYVKPTAALAVAGFAIVGWSAYSASYARFFEVEVQGAQLKLKFAGPLAKEVLVSSDAIDTVLSGSPGKFNRQCYVRIVLKSGGSYRSVLLDQEYAACKGISRDILQMLRSKTQ